MSKIGEKTIIVGTGASLTIKDSQIFIKGPVGEIMIDLPKNLILEKKENNFLLKRVTNDKKSKSLHGLYRQLINNAVVGVEKPWEKRLEVVGTGFNVKLQGEDLNFKIGYNHPVIFKKVNGINFKVEGNNKIIVSGLDKQLVGEIAYQVKIIRKPDVYKGKGIKYEGEVLRIKPGKKAKAAGAATA